ncbi:MAG: sigma-70 family RNA polymerase sigma factor [Caldilineaceae bacterium]|nr:sigma-70 family RNA polymerase sigma factor [Caldilineaceae bacterium]
MALNWSSKLEDAFSSLLGASADTTGKDSALNKAAVKEAAVADRAWESEIDDGASSLQGPASAQANAQTLSVAEREADVQRRQEEVQLILQAQREPAAFGVLYERYVDRVYAYIFHRVGNPHDAEDLTARTFYRALSRLHTYEDRGAPFSAWLFRIAHNLVANWHRDRSRRSFMSLDRLWSQCRTEETPEVQVEQEEKHHALWDAIERLPEERRNLLLYKFSSRLSNVEIGELMNKSESAIKSLYFRTLAALRQDLESREWE